MSLFFELCRLCLNNCGSLGIVVSSGDTFRHQKIRDCLSIIIADDQFKICSDCDGKLASFYQFRVDSVRVQHEFADIMRAMPYEPPYDPIYSSVYDSGEVVQGAVQDYQPNMYQLDHELHLALDDNHSLISMPTVGHNDSIYQQQVQTPSTPQFSEAPYVDSTAAPPQPTEMTLTEVLTAAAPSEDISAAMSSKEQIPVEALSEEQIQAAAPPPLSINDFPYEDFDDDSSASFPSDRNNVDNAIDRKIEEFIQNKRSKANPKICTVCNKLFRTNYKLREHMQTHAENNVKFACQFAGCGRAFKSKIGLKEHEARHTKTFNFTCEICQKQFLLRSYFLAHQKIHSTVKSFACTMCSKTFKTKQNLVNHENFHYGLKLFPCEICTKSFTTKTNLDVHARTHAPHGETHECEICRKTFKTKAYLKVHKRTHNKAEQNYACYCGRTFIQLCDLKIHEKTHTNQKDYVCETCGEAFTRKDSLKLHASSVHTKEHFFPCGKCQQTFTRKASLNKHLKKCATELT